MQKQVSAGSRRLGAALMLAGALVFLGFAAGFTWVVLSAKPPRLDTLSQITGRVQKVEAFEDAGTGRGLRLMIDQAGSVYALTIAGADRLPAREWPVGSLDPGDRVVAWYTPDAASPSAGRLWQLFRGSLRVVLLEDTAPAYSSRARRPLPWIAAGLVAGAVLLALGRILYKRARAVS